MVNTIIDSVYVTKAKKSKSVSELNSSFSSLVSETPAPCFKCKKSFDPPYKAIQCDNCASWVHVECSDLTAEQYKFLCKKNLSTSIKWFCNPCETSDLNQTKVKNNNEGLDKLANLVLQVTQQNAEILQSMKREKMVEERIKVNVTEVLEAQKEKEDRKNNLILFNIPENVENDEGRELDRRSAAKVCNFVAPDSNNPVHSISRQGIKIERLGERRKATAAIPSPKPRPIKVYVEDPTVREKVLKNARRLKNSALQYVGISADKTKQEREKDFITRNELKRRKEGGEDVVIFRGEIFLRNEAPWLKVNNVNLGDGAAGKEGSPSKFADPKK